MNLYNYHSNPSKLIGYDVAFDLSPELALEKYRGNIKEMKKREHLWKQSAEYAYYYAHNVIKGRWPEGEAVIIKDPGYAYWYAHCVIKGRFLEGEAIIATTAHYSYDYACYIINGRFPEGEAVIATSIY